MRKWTLFDGRTVLAKIETLDELKKALSAAPETASYPNACIVLKAPSGDLLSLGIVGDIGYVEYINASLNPPYLVAVEDTSPPVDSPPIVLMNAGEYTEIPRRHFIPLDKMLRVVEHFFCTQSRPDWVRWKEV